MRDFEKYSVFYNDEDMIQIYKDKSLQDSYNVSYWGLLESDELPRVIDAVINNRHKLSKAEAEEVYRKLKDASGIEITFADSGR